MCLINFKGRAEVDMPLRRFQRQYEHLSQFEREGIIGMVGVGWSARRVARQLRRSDCVLSGGAYRILSLRDNHWNPNIHTKLTGGAQQTLSSRGNHQLPNIHTTFADGAKTTLVENFLKKRSVMSRRKQRSAFDQVYEFDSGRIVAYRDCGLSFREIGSRVGRNQTTVMQI
ncbi:uncharacterized protein TNCV_3701901 [Trichonephila clavipes]|nr:uncharacterized protein TNCV_3701901 [Trichonephila clavipes]